jgi:copper(I)-binding protein
VQSARVAQSANGETMAVYASIENGGPADALTGLRPALEAIASLHEMEHADGMMTMRETARIEIPPGSTVELRPGGFHAMIEDAAVLPQPGDTIGLTFVFASGTEILVSAPVLSFADLATRR